MGQLRDLFVGLSCRLLSLLISVFVPPFPADRQFSSIVVFKPCCIGDVVNATPALAALRQAYPKARIAFVVSTWAKEAIQHNPVIDDLIECGNVGSGHKQDWREYMSLVNRLRKRGFELAVVLDRSPLISLIPFLARIPHRAGIDSSGRGFSLTVKAPWRTHRHEAELYLDVVRALGIRPGEHKTVFHVAEADQTSADRILDEALSAISKKKEAGKLAMIHAGGAVNPGMTLSAKRWLPERYADTARHLIHDGWTVLLVGAVSDRPVVDGILGSLTMDGSSTFAGGVVDLVDKLSLGELAAAARRCDLYVGNDSGPTHIAAATGTPTVAIFGPSTPEMYAPFGPKTVAVYNQVHCSPCFVNGRFASNCRNYNCMQAVEVEDVWRAIGSVLSQP